MIQRIENSAVATIAQNRNKVLTPAQSFGSVLKKAVSGIKISAHAQERIHSRNISFGSNEKLRMESAIQKAQAKGCRESIVMLEGNAFVVSINNKTIITAMDGNSVKDNIFTNIDSAVIA